MNRRHFIRAALLASVAIAAMPVSSGASPAEVTVGERVDRALEIVEVFRFSLPEKAALLGVCPHGIGSIVQLRNAALKRASFSRDTQDRIGCLVSIKRKLDELLGPGNVSAQRAWLRRPNDRFDGKGPSAMMLAGSLMDLRRAALTIESLGGAG